MLSDEDRKAVNKTVEFNRITRTNLLTKEDNKVGAGNYAKQVHDAMLENSVLKELLDSSKIETHPYFKAVSGAFEGIRDVPKPLKLSLHTRLRLIA